MDDVKLCKICGGLAATRSATPHMAYIRIKYCKECRELMRDLNVNKAMKKYRRMQQETIEKLEKENAFLREENKKIREKLIEYELNME